MTINEYTLPFKSILFFNGFGKMSHCEAAFKKKTLKTVTVKILQFKIAVFYLLYFKT